MNRLPMNPLSPEKMMGQMYLLMDKQIKSYHKHRHMGSNSSIPAELAQELMESIAYTANLVGGIYAHPNLEETLCLGQEILEQKCQKARKLLDLVNATAPGWQTECRWEALKYLRKYLQNYDRLHLAHKGPEELFYPILTSPPEGVRGIDSCLFYLHILWIENQIMAGFQEETLESFWDGLPAATLNQCEQLLLKAIAKALLGAEIGTPLLTPEEHAAISVLLMRATEEPLRDAAVRLCQWLGLTDENAKDYVHAVISQILCRIDDRACDWSALFL